MTVILENVILHEEPNEFPHIFPLKSKMLCIDELHYNYMICMDQCKCYCRGYNVYNVDSATAYLLNELLLLNTRRRT